MTMIYYVHNCVVVFLICKKKKKKWHYRKKDKNRSLLFFLLSPIRCCSFFLLLDRAPPHLSIRVQTVASHDLARIFQCLEDKPQHRSVVLWNALFQSRLWSVHACIVVVIIVLRVVWIAVVSLGRRSCSLPNKSMDVFIKGFKCLRRVPLSKRFKRPQWCQR